MFELQEIFQRLKPDFHKFAPYILEIVNICAYDDNSEKSLRDTFIYEACSEAPFPPTAEGYRDALLQLLEDYEFERGDLIQRAREFKLASPPKSKYPAPARRMARVMHPQERLQLQALRTPQRRSRGLQLADAALAMTGWFHWVKSGPRDPGFDGHFGRHFAPKARWSQTATEDGVEDHEMRFNDFALWMNEEEAAAPGREARMNCWEAVMFSAYKAKLVSRLELQRVHRRAADQYRIRHLHHAAAAAQYYQQSLSDYLQYSASVPFALDGELIPQRGDVLFWDRNQHIAISLGRTWADGRPEDEIMSLWTDKGGTFAKLTVDHMTANMLTSPRFVPCPF